MSARNAGGDPLLVERDGAVETLVINDAPWNRMGLAFSARLTRCVGRNHALDMILRARKVGLVNEVWPLGELFSRARALARELAEMPALAVREMLRCIVGADGKLLAESIAEERRAVLATMGSGEQREGMQAFLEKRRPRFHSASD
jgi:enoyl-CoA hydratase